MKKLLLFSLLFMAGLLSAQHVARIIEYKPAPGQFINTGWGDPAAAESLIGSLDGGVSLGGFGGYIVLGFEHPIENHPDNPFGVDFTIFGNALMDWSEPGSVMVMQDENQNDLADDTWYLLAGSDYYWENTVKDYQVTYTNPHQAVAADVPWTDNLGQSGVVETNDFHSQPYYPDNEIFPDVDPEQYTLGGIRLQGYVDQTDPSFVRSYARGFGFVDNVLRGSEPYDVPDNPYTYELENSGGDGFDISWAVDENGQHVQLSAIDFVKVTNSMNAQAGWLGEVSTELTGVTDVMPNANISGPKQMVVLNDIPRHAFSGTTYQAQALAFDSGMLMATAAIQWQSDKEDVAVVDENGMIAYGTTGSVTITAMLADNPEIRASVSIDVQGPEEVSIDLASHFIRVGHQAELLGSILDGNGHPIEGIGKKWLVSDETTLTVSQLTGEWTMQAEAEGTTWLTLAADGFEEVRDSVLITVLPEAVSKKVFVTVKTPNRTLIPRQAVWVEPFDLNPYVNKPQFSYDINNVEEATAAHAIAQLLINHEQTGEFFFRDDERGDNKLYLYIVPETEGSSTTYIHGYGGCTESTAFSKSWIVQLNGQNQLNNLHHMTLSDGDELTVYHIADVSQQWNTTFFTADADTVQTAQEFVMHLTEKQMQMKSDRQVEILSVQDLSNVAVWVNGVPCIYQGEEVLTGPSGNAFAALDKPGTFLLSAGNDQIQIVVKGENGMNEYNWAQGVCIYPNPASESIHIDIEQARIQSLEVLTLNGSLVKRTVPHTDFLAINDLQPGFYLLRIFTGKQWLTTKLIVK